MASYGILAQQIEDYQKAEDRYDRALRQYNNSFRRKGDKAVLYGRPSQFGQDTPAGLVELDAKGRPRGEPGSPDLYYQPYESFTGGVQAARKGETYIGRDASALRLTGRTAVTPTTYLTREVEDPTGEVRTERITEAQLASLPRYQQMFWQNAQRSTEYLDSTGQPVTATNVGDRPTKIVGDDAGGYHLETYEYTAEPKHGALRTTQSTRAQQDAIKAQQNRIAQLTIRANSADSEDSAKRRLKRVRNAEKELEQMEAGFKPRYVGELSFTQAEQKKLAAGEQTISNVERAAGKSTIQRTGAGEWSPFASSNAGEGILMRALKGKL